MMNARPYTYWLLRHPRIFFPPFVRSLKSMELTYLFRTAKEELSTPFLLMLMGGRKSIRIPGGIIDRPSFIKI
jgi:hypothetical protein